MLHSVSDWVEDHPGGPEIILNNRSKDVTPIFAPRHPSDQLDSANIPPTVKHLGSLDVESATEDEKAELRLKVSAEEEDEEERISRERDAMEERGLGVIVNMRDFEVNPNLTGGEVVLKSNRNTPSQCCQKSLWLTMLLPVMMR